MKIFRFSALVIILAVPQMLFAFGQKSIGTSTAQFLKLGVNARALGMGEAYAAVTDGSDSIYWNPAGLDRIPHSSFSFLHAIYFQQISYDFASYAHRAGNAGVFGIGVKYLNAGSIERTDSFGSNVGTYNPYDVAASFGWARQFKDMGGQDYQIGVALKMIQSRLIETAVTGALDAGVSWTPWEETNFSFVIQNAGPGLKFKTETDDLPFNLKLGSAYRSFNNWTLAADLNFPNDNHPYASFGTEYAKPISRNSTFSGRAGFNPKNMQDIPGMSSITFGAGFQWKGLSLDFGWEPFGALGNSYLTSLSRKF